MKRLLQAWGGTVLGTVFGLTNAILATRSWEPDEAADFFLVPVIILSLATIAELGLGVLSVHDVARSPEGPERQSYINDVLLTAVRRGAVAAAFAFAVALTIVQVGLGTSILVAITTVMTSIAIAGQPLLRGLDRRVLASVGGLVGATITTGLILIPVWLTGADITPLTCVLAGYSLAGVLTISVLARPTLPHDGHRALLTFRRSRFAAGHNVANLAGRQVDTMLAGWFMADQLFNSYSVTIRMAAPLGLIAFASNQAVAHDMHTIINKNAEATQHAHRVYRWATGGALIAAIGLIALGSTVGTWLFGDSIDVRLGVLILLACAYFVSVVGGPSVLLLAAGERTNDILRSSLTALAFATAIALGLAVAGQAEWSAPAFVSTWLAVNSLLAARFAQRAFSLSPWAFNFGSS